MVGVDIFNPLKELCRGVEADILNHLIHHPHFQSPAAITRAINRSRNETLKCLHGLSDGGIITRGAGSGRVYALLPANSVARRLLAFADLPRELAADFAGMVAPHRDGDTHIVLAPEQWCILTGQRNLVIAVHQAGRQFSPVLRHAMITRARTAYNAELCFLTGTDSEVGDALHGHGVSTEQWPLCVASKGAHGIHGIDLIQLLCGTGGI